MKAYEADLAYIHDAGFGEFAQRAAPGLFERLRKAAITRGLVVDLGCGSGIWAAELSKADYDVLGVDISPAMLEIAKKRAPRVQFLNESVFKVRLPHCDAVTSLGECLNYSFDPHGGASGIEQLFRRVYRALRPGGLFIFDFASLERQSPRRQYRQGKDWAILFESETFPEQRRLTRRITTFRRLGKWYRRENEIHNLYLYDRREVARQLRRIGFRLRPIRRYGEMPFPKGLAAFAARKPSK